jgi:hypothetical protein
MTTASPIRPRGRHARRRRRRRAAHPLSVPDQPARRPTTHDTTGAGTGSPTSGRRVVIPTESPGPAVVDGSPKSRLPGRGPAAAGAADRDGVDAERAWATAANSSSYLDQSPGAWTV